MKTLHALIVVGCALVLVQPARADTWLSATVASYHFDRSQDYNERNWGLGVEQDTPAGVVRVVGGFYKNSFNHENYYAGLSYAPLKWGPASFGMAFGLQHAGELLPMFMPVIQIEGDRFGVNIVGRTRIENDKAVIGLQIKWKLD